MPVRASLSTLKHCLVLGVVPYGTGSKDLGGGDQTLSVVKYQLRVFVAALPRENSHIKVDLGSGRDTR